MTRAAVPALLVLAFTGCGGDDQRASTGSKATTESAPAETETLPPPDQVTPIDGEWIGTFTKADLRAYPNVAWPAGRSHLLVSTNTIDFWSDRGRSEQIVVRINGRTVRTGVNTGCTDRRGRQDGGKLRYTLRGDRLTFRAIEEPCGETRFLLTRTEWRRP